MVGHIDEPRAETTLTHDAEQNWISKTPIKKGAVNEAESREKMRIPTPFKESRGYIQYLQPIKI
jgi:hypothetical protein